MKNGWQDFMNGAIFAFVLALMGFVIFYGNASKREAELEFKLFHSMTISEPVTYGDHTFIPLNLPGHLDNPDNMKQISEATEKFLKEHPYLEHLGGPIAGITKWQLENDRHEHDPNTTYIYGVWIHHRNKAKQTGP